MHIKLSNVIFVEGALFIPYELDTVNGAGNILQYKLAKDLS